MPNSVAKRQDDDKQEYKSPGKQLSESFYGFCPHCGEEGWITPIEVQTCNKCDAQFRVGTYGPGNDLADVFGE